MGELDILCFDLGLDPDNLQGETKVEKANSIIINLMRNGRLEDLLILLQEERPNISIPPIPSPNQQIQDAFNSLSEESLDAVLNEYLAQMSQLIVNNSPNSEFNPEKKVISAINVFSKTLLSQLQGTRLETALRYLSENNAIPYLNLSGFDFSNLNLIRLNLKKAKFSSTNLSNTNFSYSHLDGADLSKSDLREADLSLASLDGVNLAKAHINENTKIKKKFELIWQIQSGNFSEVNFSQQDLSGANLVGVDFKKTNLSGTNLSNASLMKVNLSETNLDKANLSNADLFEANLRKASAREANFGGASLSKTNMSEANLEKASLILVKIVGADLRKVNLESAVFCSLASKNDEQRLNSEEKFSEIISQYFQFQGRNLAGAQILNSDLSGANLKNTDLRFASLIGSNLSLVQLDYADLRGVDFGANSKLVTNSLDPSLLSPKINLVGASLVEQTLKRLTFAE